MANHQKLHCLFNSLFSDIYIEIKNSSFKKVGGFVPIRPGDNIQLFISSFSLHWSHMSVKSYTTTLFSSLLQLITRKAWKVRIIDPLWGESTGDEWITRIKDQWWGTGINRITPGPRFNIKMSSYQYRKSHCGDKAVVRSSYLHSGISYAGKMVSLYWFSTLVHWQHKGK